MKKIVFFLALCFFTFNAVAQQQYTVLGETYNLKSEISGTLELLWNIIDGKYRYFVKKENAIVELTNTKGPDNRFQEEYKVILDGITPDANLPTDKLKLTLYSLRNFIYDYNVSVDPNYTETSKAAGVESRILFFGGLTNSPFIENTDNISNLILGGEIEVFEAQNLPKHALYLNLRYVLSHANFNYTSTRFTIGYRFRFINNNAFSLYANVDLANYSFTKSTITYTNEVDQLVTDEVKNDGFDAPFIFGLGADIKISDQSFITLSYNELFALLLDTHDNFSTSFAIGYKLKL